MRRAFLLYVDGGLVRLTLCPRSMSNNDKRWSAPFTVNADAVTYIHPIPLPGYEPGYEGCRLLLMGNRLDEIPIEQLGGIDVYPHIDVWERYDLVYDALRKAGWNTISRGA